MGAQSSFVGLVVKKMMKLQQITSLTSVLLLLAVFWQSQSLPHHHHNNQEDDGCRAGYQMVPTNNAVFPGGDAQCCDIGRPYCCVDIPEIYVICVYNATYSWGEFLKTGEKNLP